MRHSRLLRARTVRASWCSQEGGGLPARSGPAVTAAGGRHVSGASLLMHHAAAPLELPCSESRRSLPGSRRKAQRPTRVTGAEKVAARRRRCLKRWSNLLLLPYQDGASHPETQAVGPPLPPARWGAAWRGSQAHRRARWCASSATARHRQLAPGARPDQGRQRPTEPATPPRLGVLSFRICGRHGADSPAAR